MAHFLANYGLWLLFLVVSPQGGRAAAAQRDDAGRRCSARGSSRDGIAALDKLLMKALN